MGHLRVESEDEGKRLDVFLNEQLDTLTRTYIQKLVKEGLVLVNQKAEKVSYRVSGEDLIAYEIPPGISPEILPEDIPLDILYEDEDVLLVNKPKGMVVHPAAGHYSGTLVNALMFHCRGHLSGINGILRPGIVHRIDKDTTGVLVVCKTDLAHQSLSEQLKAHTLTRRYYAITTGHLQPEEGTVHLPIGRHPVDRKKMATRTDGGKEAVTHYRVMRSLNGFDFIECQLETGRTHQIRVHMAALGHPLLGDTLYGGPDGKKILGTSLDGQTLHAYILGFIHPRTGTYLEFEAPMPQYFQKLLDHLSTH